MSVLSVACCSLLSAVCAFTLVSAAGCGTDAKGVDDCRDIEEARCAAAKNCAVVTDVDACKRFYRDQCLHGLAVTSPGSLKVKACVATIQNAGACAAQAPDGAATTLDQCTVPVTSSAPGAATACDIVKEPELSAECAFLIPSAAAGGSGGQGGGGAGGASPTGGTGGTAGADDTAGSP
jgi:hypothetical protein